MSYRLSPSDPIFLSMNALVVSASKNVKHNFRRPAVPSPSVFTIVDGLLKSFFHNQTTPSDEYLIAT